MRTQLRLYLVHGLGGFDVRAVTRAELEGLLCTGVGPSLVKDILDTVECNFPPSEPLVWLFNYCVCFYNSLLLFFYISWCLCLENKIIF